MISLPWREGVGDAGRRATGVLTAAATVLIPVCVLAALLQLCGVVSLRDVRELGPVWLAMTVPPERAVDRALARGDSAFLFVSDWMAATGVDNTCLRDRYGWAVIRGTTDVIRSDAEGWYQDVAVRYGRSYNLALAARLGVSPEEMVRDGDCGYKPNGWRWPREGPR